jgi:hypothetical protein
MGALLVKREIQRWAHMRWMTQPKRGRKEGVRERVLSWEYSVFESMTPRFPPTKSDRFNPSWMDQSGRSADGAT